jgi:hypothetical protein
MLTVAALFPVAVGVNMTLNVQLSPGSTVLVQVVVSAKSPVFAPVRTGLLMIRVACATFVRVTTEMALLVPTIWFSKQSTVMER